MMKPFLIVYLLLNTLNLFAKKDIHALYIPLADHYAAVIAYEKYGKKMKHANFTITQMKNWDLLRAYFQSKKVDMAFSMTPLAIDMYNEKPHFQWIGLMHRDGNALAVNDTIAFKINLSKERLDRKPTQKLAEVLQKIYKESKRSTHIGLPHLLSTHAVVLYKFLKEHNTSISFSPNIPAVVTGRAIAPPKAPAFLKINSKRTIPAAIEQSLPWADVAESKHFGKLAWYSKDIIPWEHGHVECIALATKEAIESKERALKEVMYYIHKAGADIEDAKKQGGKALDKIVKMVRKHIPFHTEDAIIASLRADLNVINYNHLNIDTKGLKLIMDLAIEGGVLKQGLNIDKFANENFHIELPKPLMRHK